MSENKVKLSLTLSADNHAQMQALANFAATLALGEPSSIKATRVDHAAVKAPSLSTTPAARYGYMDGDGTVSVVAKAPVFNLAEEEKPKRKRRTAAEMKAVESAESEAAEVAESAPAEVESEEAEEEAPAPKSPPAASKITLDDVRRAVAEKKEKHLQIMKFKLKEDFGVSKTPDLAPHQYEAFYNFLQSLD
jgi:hypothetical protein